MYGGGKQTEEYTALLRRHCKNFREKVAPYDIAGAVQRFFAGQQYYEDAFVGAHSLTWDFFYAQTRALEIYPAAGDPARRRLDADLHKFFEKWAADGRLLEPVVCRVAAGCLDKNLQPVADLSIDLPSDDAPEFDGQPTYATH